MRSRSTAASIEALMSFLGERASGPGRIYLTGGATAVLRGWREATLDVDLKLDPEPPGVFEAIRAAKDELGINVELAAPDDFIPPLPGWRERSEFIARCGPIDFFHYDGYAQALAKIERGHTQDVADVRALLDSGLVEPTELRRLFAAILSPLIRYPAIDADAFAAKLEAALAARARDTAT